MADSDDEYDRKRRDKFRGERSSGDNYRSDRRDDRSRGREDWPDRGRSRPDYREYRPRDRFSPDRHPPMKRMRGDWGGDDGRPRYGGHDGYGAGYGGGGWGGHDHYPPHGQHGGGFMHGPGGGALHGRLGAGADPSPNPDLQTQPQMLTLKQFLASQDDSISDSDAITKYNEYKLEFKRQQLNEFFVAHKDEEWFKIKYHPEDSLNRKKEQLNFLKNRASVFNEVLEADLVTSVSVDTTQSEKLLRLLDTVVIKLEGGTEEDLKILEEKPIEYRAPEILKEPPSSTPTSDIKASADNNNEEEGKKGNDDWDLQLGTDEMGEEIKKPIPEDEQSETNADSRNDGSGEVIKLSDEVVSVEKNTKKRKRTTSGSSSSSRSSSSSSSDSDEEDEEKKEKSVEREETQETNNISAETESEAASEADVVMKSAEVDEVKDEDQSKKLNNDDAKPNDTEEDKQEGSDEECENKDDDDDNKKEEDVPETIDLDKESDSKDEDEKSGPRALHRTSSIFLRNLAPTITKAEVEAMCKRYNGFLRVAIADPLVERRWFRRGWVTFKRDINIKEICWNLNNIRLRDCELGAIVNRDLSRRVRPVNGVTAHKTIVRSDIKLCARIAHNLDVKVGLWTDDNKERSENGNSASFGLNSNNPVLQNITDYLIEEASAEEDELLGLANSDNKDSEGELLERDPQLLSVLDKLILYLRIVHSVDFYNHCEYPYEDEMPNRCGIIHARGPAPQNKVTATEIQDYIRNFEGKMSSFLAKSVVLEDGELKKIGCKDVEAEVEKFVQANTQELAKDKWLCPLSGKKFKGPEFIRKHIFNKHGEKVDEVKKEVEYFNNYLKDPKRPQLPEHPGNTKKAAPETQPIPGFRPGYPGPGYAPPYAYAPPMAAPIRQRGGFGGRRELPVEHQRRVIGYQDLDAPANDFEASMFS